MMVSDPRLVRRGMSARLTDKEWDSVTKCCTSITELPAKTTVSRKGEDLDRSLLLLKGIIGRHVPGPHRDKREMVALEVPGDFVDLHSFPVGALDHDVTAVTDVTLAVFPHAALRSLMRSEPDVALALWSQTVVDAAIHRYWAYRVGALRATGRVANFLCEMEQRLKAADLVDGDSFELPLTQMDLAEACGMSAVHVNRVMRELRESGCCIVKGRRVRILDKDKLIATGQFEPSFLNIGA